MQNRQNNLLIGPSLWFHEVTSHQK